MLERSDPTETSFELDRQRDNQQWILDYLVKIAGREQNFEYDDRLVPSEVKSYAMIPHSLYRRGAEHERIARAAEEAGGRATALELYWKAVVEYRNGQHAIFRDDDPEKQFLHQRMTECYDRIIELADHPIERVEIEWEGHQLSAILHLQPGRPKAPTILYCPGMDNTKEGFPNPQQNLYAQRGMNLLCIDGPGQGVSNLRKVRITDDNYERAASAFIDWLVDRDEVDSDRIGVAGTSMGSHWGTRIAAVDERVKAVATTAACYGTKRAIFQTSSPRFKQIFMYMAGLRDEQEFDRMAERMHLLDHAPRIKGAALMVVGEYDPLCPLREAYAVFERIGGPKEFWLVENEFHSLGRRGIRNLGGLSAQPFMADWLHQTLERPLPQDHRRELVIPASGGSGPYQETSPGFWYPERAEESYLPSWQRTPSA